MHPFVTRAVAVLALAASSTLAHTDDVSITPRPTSVKTAKGTFTLSARTVIVTDRADSAVAQRLAFLLAPATGFALPVRIGTTASGNRIVFRRAAARDTTFG